jgi:hypothetical protein
MYSDSVTMGEEEGLSRRKITTIEVGGRAVKILLRIR